MLQIGDVIKFDTVLWLITKIDSGTKTAFLESNYGEIRVLGIEEKADVLYNPLTQWLTVSLPLKSGVVGIIWPSLQGEVPLVRLQQWVTLDRRQVGGLLYLNPGMQLGSKDRLIGLYSSRQRMSIDIPRVFPTVAQRVARKPAERPPATMFDHLKDEEE